MPDDSSGTVVSQPAHPHRFFRDARDVPPRPAIGRDLQPVQAHAASLMWGAPNFWLVGKHNARMRYAAPQTKRNMGRIGKLRLLTAILMLALLDAVSQRAVFAVFAYTSSQSSSARCRALDGAGMHRDLRAVSSSLPEVRYQLGA